MITSEGCVLELGHQPVATEKRLGDHLLISSGRNLAEESIQTKLPLQHLVERALEHNWPRVFWVIDHGFLGTSQVHAPCGSQVIQPGTIVLPAASFKQVVEVLIPLGMPVLRSER